MSKITYVNIKITEEASLRVYEKGLQLLVKQSTVLISEETMEQIRDAQDYLKQQK